MLAVPIVVVWTAVDLWTGLGVATGQHCPRYYLRAHDVRDSNVRCYRSGGVMLVCRVCRRRVTVSGEENMGKAVHDDGRELGPDGHLAAPIELVPAGAR
jgi:hypothetical protein